MEGKDVDRHDHCVGVLVPLHGQTLYSAALNINRGHYHVGIIKTLCLLMLSPMFPDDFWLRLSLTSGGHHSDSSRGPNEILCRWAMWAASLPMFFGFLNQLVDSYVMGEAVFHDRRKTCVSITNNLPLSFQVCWLCHCVSCSLIEWDPGDSKNC